MAKDYYNILGVNKSASAEEIKKAYYKMAHQHHPHKGGDEAKMKEINEAYGVLGNQEKRGQYDQFGQTFDQAKSQGGFGGFSDFSQGFGGNTSGGNFSFDLNDLGDVFGDLFGNSRAKSSGRGQRAGEDIMAELTIDFYEAAFGAEKVLSLNKTGVCQTCQGSGAEPGTKIITCQTCQGSGQVVRNIGFGIGFPSQCPDCEGRGKKAEKKCNACRGEGREKQTEELTIKIPAGIDNGQSIRLSDKGNSGRQGGENGDLYLKIKVLPDWRFRREGFDLYAKAEISFTQAALGGKIEVETLKDKVTLKIPDGTQSGKVFRLKGRGIPHLHGRGQGDLFAEIIVKTPTRLSRRQKELLSELANN